MNDIHNPDPAWPESITFLFALALIGLSTGLSSHTLGWMLENNWWPFLRIILAFWVILRVADAFAGGPRRRAAMRTAYRQLTQRV